MDGLVIGEGHNQQEGGDRQADRRGLAEADAACDHQGQVDFLVRVCSRYIVGMPTTNSLPWIGPPQQEE